MEEDGSVMSRSKTTPCDETPEESSWTMYFEDFFSERSDMQTRDDSISDDYLRHRHHHHHDSSSLVSDAASFVGMKKISIVRDEEPSSSSSKKRRSREVSVVARDLEDTASSPSHSPNVYSMMNLLDNNTTHEDVGAETTNGKGKRSGQDGGVGLSIGLKKKGLCLVPLSMVADFID